MDRTVPVLPLLPTTPAWRSHDDVRHGTASLFAALDAASGQVISQLHRRHRHQEFLKFLRAIDGNVPAGLELHLVCDNCATYKTPAIKTWLLRHPRFHLHFTPTSASWLNMVERWFAELTNRKLRRSSHRSVAELEADLSAWIAAWNQDPKRPSRGLLPSFRRFETGTQRNDGSSRRTGLLPGCVYAGRSFFGSLATIIR